MKTDRSPEALVRQLEERLLQPVVRQSPEAVAELLADDFVEFASSGHGFDKPATLAGLRQETPATLVPRPPDLDGG